MNLSEPGFFDSLRNTNITTVDCPGIKTLSYIAEYEQR